MKLSYAALFALFACSVPSAGPCADSSRQPLQASEIQARIRELLSTHPKTLAAFNASVEQRERDIDARCNATPPETRSSCGRDAELTTLHWLQSRHLSALLSAPPLRPRTSEHVKYLIGDDLDGAFAFARDAPVALFVSPRLLQLLDVATGRVLLDDSPVLRHEWRSTTADSLAPNGRAFAEVGRSGIAFRDSTDGAVVLSLDDYDSVFWLTSRVILLGASGLRRPSVVMDLRHDHALPITDDEANEIADAFVERVFPVANHPNAFSLCYGGNVHTLQLVNQGSELQAQLLPEASIGGQSQVNCAFARDDFAQTRIVARDTSVLTTSFGTNIVSRYSYGELDISDAVPSSSASRWVIYGYVDRIPLIRRHPLLLDMDTHLVAPLDAVLTRTAQLVAIPSIRFAGIKRRSCVELLDIPDSPSFEDPDHFIDRLRLLQAHSRYREAEYGNRNSEPLLVDEVLTDLSREADVVGFGVNESDAQLHTTGNTGAWGQIDIDVGSTDKPLVLLLSSSHPVQWNLRSAPASKVILILLAGYEGSYAIGFSGVPRVQVGFPAPYSRDSTDFDELNRLVQKLIGRDIVSFTGKYSASHFRLGSP